MPKWTPLHDQVLVRRVEEAQATKGGIIIPDTAKEKPQEGEVVAVGAGRVNDEGKVFPLSVKEGDRVLFRRYGGDEVKIEGETLLIMEEKQIVLVLSGAATGSKKELASSRK